MNADFTSLGDIYLMIEKYVETLLNWQKFILKVYLIKIEQLKMTDLLCNGNYINGLQYQDLKFLPSPFFLNLS